MLSRLKAKISVLAMTATLTTALWLPTIAEAGWRKY